MGVMGDLYGIIIYEKVPASLAGRLLSFIGFSERGICLRKQGECLCPKDARLVEVHGYFPAKQLPEMVKYLEDTYHIAHSNHTGL